MCRISHYIKVPSTGETEWPYHRFHGLLPRVIGAIDCTHVQIVGPDKVLTRCLVWTAKAPVSHRSVPAIVDTAHTTHAVVIRVCTLEFCWSSSRTRCQERFSFVLHFASCHLFYFLNCSICFPDSVYFGTDAAPYWISFLMFRFLRCRLFSCLFAFSTSMSTPRQKRRNQNPIQETFLQRLKQMCSLKTVWNFTKQKLEKQNYYKFTFWKTYSRNGQNLKWNTFLSHKILLPTQTIFF